MFVDPDRAAGVFGVLGTSFAVLLAFVIFVALESYGNARETAGVEAVAVTQLYRTTALLAEPGRGELRDELVCYARAIIVDEWRTMREGRESAVVQGWVDALAATTAALSPRNARETVAYEQWFTQDAERRAGRRGAHRRGRAVRAAAALAGARARRGPGDRLASGRSRCAGPCC